jgi:hypothetical protein
MLSLEILKCKVSFAMLVEHCNNELLQFCLFFQIKDHYFNKNSTSFKLLHV